MEPGIKSKQQDEPSRMKDTFKEAAGGLTRKVVRSTHMDKSIEAKRKVCNYSKWRYFSHFKWFNYSDAVEFNNLMYIFYSIFSCYALRSVSFLFTFGPFLLEVLMFSAKFAK